MRSKAMGRAIRAAVMEQSLVSRQLPAPSCRISRSFGDRTQAAKSIRLAVTHSARAVPRAAPATPISARGMVIPSSGIWMEGKIRNQLKITSNPHIMAFSILGVRMFPLHCSILLVSCRIWTAGRAVA